MRNTNKYFILLRRVPGIYSIQNKINNKLYVGNSADIGKRFMRHTTCLRGGYHPNAYLQSAWKKYGEPNFIFNVIEITPKSNLVKQEQYWIDKYNTLNDKLGYNICPFANKSGMSEETKAKISRTKKGVPMKEETKRKLSIAKKGIKLNLSPEAIKKMGDASRLRKGVFHHSEETKRKISKSKKGQISRKGFKLPEYQKQILREYRLKNPQLKDPLTGRFISN